MIYYNKIYATPNQINANLPELNNYAYIVQTDFLRKTLGYPSYK